MDNVAALTVNDWLKSRIASEPYWFHRMELSGGLVTPGWNDPKVEKLPYFGLPDNMTGMRVLDIGHAEGFFSFEAERRGAAEVVGIENYPPMARKFQICRTAFGSRATSHLANIYDISPKTFGTFDLVMFSVRDVDLAKYAFPQSFLIRFCRVPLHGGLKRLWYFYLACLPVGLLLLIRAGWTQARADPYRLEDDW